MKNNSIPFIATLLLASAMLPSFADVENLRCEYRENPLGIDVVKPRLSWKISDQLSVISDQLSVNSNRLSVARSVVQTAYQVLVASSEELLKKDQGDLWDSGKVESDQSIHVEYKGKALESRMSCYWKVRVWTSNDETRNSKLETGNSAILNPDLSAVALAKAEPRTLPARRSPEGGGGTSSSWSPPASWSMGLIKPDDWSAKWIGLDRSEGAGNTLLDRAQWVWFPEGDPASGAAAGACYFRRAFTLPADPKITKATIQMTADNAFELYLNGKKVGQGDDWNMPVMLDLTESLHAGTNVLAVAATNAGEDPSPAGLIAALSVEFAEGEPLVVRTATQWKCRREKTEGWETAGFDDSQWPAAKALGAFGTGPWGQLNQGQDARPLPARYLRREFPVGKKVAKATTYVSGMGFFELYLNGEKVSDHMMDPVLSDYRKAVHYVTFDVTSHLKNGRNAIGVVLGNGRFFAPRLHTPMATVDYGYPKLFLQTEIAYTDGSNERIVSDESWALTTQGPIRANNEYDGEEYDARMEMDGWSRTGFDDAKWEKAQAVDAPGGVLVAQVMEPMRATQVLKPVGMTEPKPGVFLVDFGQNFYGTVRLKARGPAGTEVRMTSAYSLLPDGTLKTADNRGAKATDVYTFKGKGEEVWNPVFKGQGFRRVQVTGFPGTPTADNFEGLVIHTDVEPAGEFACSNELVNRIHQAMRWGMRMFLRSAPLDPDRDERQAWMGDPAKDSESEAFNFNVAAFYTKWMDDVRRSQRDDGSMPEVAMNWDFGMNSIDWPSVYTIIPDWYLDFYADPRVAAMHYASMKRWVVLMDQRNRQPDGTVHGGMFGDWCDAYTMDGQCGESGQTDVGLVHSAYHYNNCRIMARAAKRLGKDEDVKLFSGMAERMLAAFNKRFFDPATGKYGNGTQCSYVLPLAFGMVPAESLAKVAENLVKDILLTRQGHLSVGLIGMQWLLQVLTDIGRPDVAWILMTQTTRPSWGYMIGKGSTTIWERWDSDTRDPGMNSEALLILAGNADAWLYQALAGINYDREKPGFKHIILRPRMVGDLKWVKAHFNSPYGKIASHLQREGEKLTMEVTIPANTTATVHVPAKDAAGVTESGQPVSKAAGVKFLRLENGAAVYEVGSGYYQFQSSVKKTEK
jgi:alpha-L-rhamnosidase